MQQQQHTRSGGAHGCAVLRAEACSAFMPNEMTPDSRARLTDFACCSSPAFLFYLCAGGGGFVCPSQDDRQEGFRQVDGLQSAGHRERQVTATAAGQLRVGRWKRGADLVEPLRPHGRIAQFLR